MRLTEVNSVMSKYAFGAHAELLDHERTSTKLYLPELRSRMRYPIALNLRYYPPAKRTPVSGVGTTVNLSSRGVLILARRHKVARGAALEVSMDWPIPVDGTTPLQLIVVGRVVRSNSNSFAVSFSAFDFQARKKQPGTFTGPIISEEA
jgi:hypothetical protein